MMPARGVRPSWHRPQFPGRASPALHNAFVAALHNANLGDRPPGCPHSARPNSAGQSLLTAPFVMVTAVFGAPSPAPPATPAFATSWTAFSEAASIVPNGV